MSKLFQCPAYHKAGYENAIKSLKWQSFFIGKAKRLWLGDGVYFWQYYEDAEWWPGNYVNPVILVADLECEQKSFLDLDDPDVRKYFYDFMKAAFAELARQGINMHINGKELVNSASCNYYKKMFNMELIRYSFPDRSNRPQFCASTSSIAKNIRIANKDWPNYLKENPYAYI